MEALPASDFTSGLSYTHKLRLGVTNIDDYGLTLARDVKMPENLIDHAIEIGKRLRHTKVVSMHIILSVTFIKLKLFFINVNSWNNFLSSKLIKI